MKNIELAFRTLFKKGRSNVIKIVSLAVGLAMGSVLIAKIYFEQSYDSFYPASDRIYRVETTSLGDGEGEDKTFGQVSGAIAPAMKSEIPEVELATRFTWFTENDVILTTDKKSYSIEKAIAADSSFFDMFPRPILVGDPKEVLVRPNYVMICASLARKMGGVENVVGMVYTRQSLPGTEYVVGGVFEDLPENSHIQAEIICAITTIPEWSITNWVGNDRYRAYVKLYPGVRPETLAPSIRKMQELHQDLEVLKKAGVNFTYTLLPLEKIYAESKEVRDMNRMLILLAVTLLLTSVLNYLLIVVSTLIGRTKEVAVHKCYGASGRNILGLTMAESMLHLVLSLLIAIILIFVFRSTVEELLTVSVGALFNPSSMIIISAVCVVVFLITTLVPTYLNVRTPVMYAFRQSRESKRYWKLGLLFVQFTATAYLITLLLIINRQYDRMVTDYPGYETENLFYLATKGVDSQQRQRILDEMGRLPDVETVSSCYTLPFYGQSGNNVSLPEGEYRELMNIADLYYVSDNYFSAMRIPIIEGEAFSARQSATNSVMVSRSFVKRMEVLVGWKGSPLGKSIVVSQHSGRERTPFTICGVYEDFRIGSIQFTDLRPTVVFYTEKPSDILLIKLDKYGDESLAKIADLLKRVNPDRAFPIYSMKEELINEYRSSRLFRDSIMISGIVTLIIALVGLIGYTMDETNRRRSEIAVRKINGATIADVIKMILRDISLIALPSIFIGVLLGNYSGREWITQFSEKAVLTPFLFIAGAFSLYLVIIGCVVMRSWKAATDNPIDALKAE